MPTMVLRFVIGIIALVGAGFPAEAQQRTIVLELMPASPLADRIIAALDPMLEPDSDLNPRAELRENLYLAEVDLNDDGIPELMVGLPAPYGGSAGNTTYVMKRHGDRLLPIGAMVTQGEVEVLPGRDKGYHRLRSPYVTLFWAGREYFEEDWYREAKAKCRLRSHFGHPQDPCGP